MKNNNRNYNYNNDPQKLKNDQNGLISRSNISQRDSNVNGNLKINNYLYFNSEPF